MKFVFLLVAIVALAECLSAQEVEGQGKSGSGLFSPADYLEISAPISERVGVNTYGFYLGNLQSSIALLEVPVKLTQHVSFTPSYLFINVPANGLALLAGKPPGQSYQENQLRMAVTASIPWHGFVLADRNMYVRRFTSPAAINRYRNRIYLARPLSVASFRFSPFFFDEVYHDFVPGNWIRRNWVVGGVDTPVNGNFTLQVSYIRQDDQYLRSVNFLGVGLIIRTGKLLGERQRDRGEAE